VKIFKMLFFAPSCFWSACIAFAFLCIFQCHRFPRWYWNEHSTGTKCNSVLSDLHHSKYAHLYTDPSVCNRTQCRRMHRKLNSFR
jgi:hypothetical protein